MSKLSFRARALDASKPMPIYHKDELSDLQDYSVLNRAVPQMPSGMEKEEESEHHLQRAISAQQVYGDAKVMVIPVPEAEISLACYNNLYKKPFRLPKHYVHNQAQALNSILEQEKPDYDMDSDDEKWVKDSKKRVGIDISPDQFEEMIDRLEKSCGKQIVTLQEAKLLLKEDDDLIKAVYEYWTKKRTRRNGPLILQVRQERRDGSSNNDCYVAFRRRTEKMQTRKNRKNDEISYEKMLKLRRELSRAVTILEMIKRREKSKREFVHLTLEVIEKRFQMKDFDGKSLRSVKKELNGQQRARPPFRSLSGSTGPFRKKRLFNTVSKPKPSLINIPSISRGELNRDDLSKKLKKKRPRLPLTVGSSVSTPFLPTAKPTTDWRASTKVSTAASHPPNATPSSSKSPSFSYQEVVDTMTQYEFPPSDNDESTSPVSNGMLADGFDPKKHPDGVFTFRRKSGCSYYAPRDTLVGDWPWLSGRSPRYRYSLTSLSVPDKCIGFSRRRVGRGGRVVLDRAYHPYDKHFERLDLRKEHSNFHPPTDELQDILSEIKKNRWRHYEATKEKTPVKTSESTTKSDPFISLNTAFNSNENFPFSVTELKQTTSTSLPKHKKTPKKSQTSTSVELSKSSVAFAMSALVTVASSSTSSTTTTSCTKTPRTVSNLAHSKILTKSQMSSMRKCATCGGIITLASTTSDSRPNMGSSTSLSSSSHPQHPRVVPLTLSLATSSHQPNPQRTTVLPTNVPIARGLGSHTTGVPALLRISSSGAVVGGTVLYPQSQTAYIKTEDPSTSSKTKKEVISMTSLASSGGVTSQPRRTLTQRTARAPVNLNLALPANVLASINSDGSTLRAPQSAPNSPRSLQSHHGDGGGQAKSISTSNNPKTISLNLSQLNASQGSLFMPNNSGQIGQVVNAGRLTMTGNLLKLGNTLLHVALPPSTRQSATSSGAPSSENTLLVGDGNLILATMDENKQKRAKVATEQSGFKSELIPMTLTTLHSAKKNPPTTVEGTSSHSVQVSLGATSKSEPSSSAVSVEPLAAVTTNTVTVKSSKPTRPMEVT